MTYRLSKSKRCLCFIGGLAISGFGVAMSTRPGLGTSPISSVPYVMTFIVPWTLGTWTVIINALMVLGQILILRKEYKWIQVCQIFAAAVFGAFIDLGMWVTGFFPFQLYALRMTEQILGCLLIAAGIVFDLLADFSYMPGEGLVKAISSHWKLNFGKVKIGFDISMVTIAACASYCFCGTIHGVREGTLIAAILVGFFIKQLVNPFHPVRKILLKRI